MLLASLDPAARIEFVKSAVELASPGTAALAGLPGTGEPALHTGAAAGRASDVASTSAATTGPEIHVPSEMGEKAKQGMGANSGANAVAKTETSKTPANTGVTGAGMGVNTGISMEATTVATTGGNTGADTGTNSRADMGTNTGLAAAHRAFLQTRLLQEALDTLEGHDLAGPGLDATAMQLEAALEDLKPGSLGELRAQWLANVINAKGDPVSMSHRAAQVASVLSRAEWDANSTVAAAVRDLQSAATVTSPPELSFFQSAGIAFADQGGLVAVFVIYVVVLLVLDRQFQQQFARPVPPPGYGAAGNTPQAHV